MNQKNPLITVMMAAHRNDEFLEQAINSVLGQTFSNFELIIVENAGNDALWQKLQGFKDDRIRLFRTNIRQIAFNRNYCLNESRAELIAVMDSDDVCEPHRFENQFKFLSENPTIDVVGSSYLRISPSNEIIGKVEMPLTDSRIRKTMFVSNPFCNPTVMFRKKSVLDIGGYLGGFHSEDYDLWLRLAGQSSARFANIETHLLRYRVHSNTFQQKPASYYEMSAHFLRQLFLTPSAAHFKGFLIAFLKALRAKKREIFKSR